MRDISQAHFLLRYVLYFSSIPTQLDTLSFTCEIWADQFIFTCISLMTRHENVPVTFCVSLSSMLYYYFFWSK